jgi:putative redox protein
MATITTKLKWDGELQFTGRNAKGFETVMDGNVRAAASPMEILLESLGGCTAIDVVLILQKMREPLTGFEVSLDGERNETEPKYYKSVRVRFDLWGDNLSADKVGRAIDLSFAKYCSVFHSLRADLKASAEFRVHATGAEAGGEYRVVEIASHS